MLVGFGLYFDKIGFWSLRSFVVHFLYFHIPGFQSNPHKLLLQRYSHLQITSISIVYDLVKLLLVYPTIVKMQRLKLSKTVE